MKKLFQASIFIFCLSIFAFAQTSNSGCPKITISGPDGLVKLDESISFKANVENANESLKLEFEWEVSQGMISEGQGTSSITVETTQDMAGSNVTATVKVKGLNSICNKEASETVPIENSTVCGLGIGYNKLPLEDEFGRFDNFFVSLINNPSAKGYIFFEIEKTEKLSDVAKRLTSIFDHIKNRNFNRDLILYDICYAEDNQTTFRLILEGATLPETPNCEKVEIDLK